MLIKQKNQKSVIFVTISIFLSKGFKFQPKVCNKCHDLLMVFMNLGNIAILNIGSTDFCCIISGISKNEAISIIQSADLTEKCGA